MNDKTLGIIIIVLTLVAAFNIIYVIMMFLKSYRVRLRDPMNKSKYITDIWVIEKVDKYTNSRRWVNVPFFFNKFISDRPPDAALEVGKRGRLYAEAYKMSDDEFVWITDKGLDKETIIEENQKKLTESFKPYSHTQRTVLIYQKNKAEEINKNRRWTPAEILQFAMLGGLFMIIIVGFVFGGDIIKGWADIQENQNKAIDNVARVTNNLALVSEAIGVNIPNLNITVTQTVPAKTSTGIITEGQTVPT